MVKKIIKLARYISLLPAVVSAILLVLTLTGIAQPTNNDNPRDVSPV